MKSIKQNDLKVFFFYSTALFLFLAATLYFRFILLDQAIRFIVIRIFLVIQFIFLSIYYYYNIRYSKKKIILLVSIIAYIFFSILDYSIFKDKKTYYVPLAIECVFFVIVIMFFFYEKMKFIAANPIYKLPSFWISVAFLIFFSGTFFLFIASIYVINDPVFKKQYQFIYGTVSIIKNILLVVGISANKNYNYNDNKDVPAIQPDVDLESFNPFKK